MIQHEAGKTLTYKQLASLVDFFALRLLDMGFRKGDRVATMLVLVPEHIAMMEKKRLVWLKLKDALAHGLANTYAYIDSQTPALTRWR